MGVKRIKITEGTLKGLKSAPTGQRDYVWDERVPGFGIVTTDTGASSYIAYTRWGRIAES